MVHVPEPVTEFLRGKRVAVTGVSRFGGCPLMYCAPVDFGHRCMRWWLRRQGCVPG
jgi:hypothetical protein